MFSIGTMMKVLFMSHIVSSTGKRDNGNENNEDVVTDAHPCDIGGAIAANIGADATTSWSIQRMVGFPSFTFVDYISLLTLGTVFSQCNKCLPSFSAGSCPRVFMSVGPGPLTSVG